MIATPFPVLSLVPPMPLPVVSSGSVGAAAIGTAGVSSMIMILVIFYSPVPRKCRQMRRVCAGGYHVSCSFVVF